MRRPLLTQALRLEIDVRLDLGAEISG